MAVALRLVAVGLPMYFAEELLQMPAYVRESDSLAAVVALCGLAAVGDVVILLGLWAAAAAAFRSPAWFSPPRLLRYAAVVAGGIAVGAIIEWVAIHRLGLWTYPSWQPVLPPLGTGLVAVAQPVLVLPLTFWLMHRWRETGRRSSSMSG
jgi:hypothetical protein